MNSPSITPSRLVGLLALHATYALHALLAGCGTDAPLVFGPPGDRTAPAPAPTAAPPIPTAHAPAPPVVRGIAWTAMGDIAVFDARSGAVIASSPGAALGGVRDLSIDDTAAQAIAFEGNDDATWGDIATYSLESNNALGVRVHRAYVDGDARILAVPSGIAVFSDGPGPRWKVLRDDGIETLGISMPRPRSITMGAEGAGFLLGSLAYDDSDSGPTLEIDAAYEIAGTLGALDDKPLALTPSNPPSARLVTTSLGADVLLDVAAGGLALTPITAGDVGAVAMVALAAPVHRIEAAVMAGEDLIAVLTSGPSRVVVIALDPRAVFGVKAAASVDLPGDVRVEDRFFSRDLALVGTRLFAATNAGLFAVDVSNTQHRLVSAIDPSFEGSALRGPVAGLPLK